MLKTGMILWFGLMLASTAFGQEVLTSSRNLAGVVSPYKTDFQSAYSSSNEALKKVASLIESGRKKKNVQTLLSASLILFLEEKTTGEKASITGLSLLKEATELALRSRNKDLIKLVALFWDDPAFGNDQKYAFELTYDE